MNYGYMQQLIAEQERENATGARSVGADAHPGLHIGQYMNVNADKSGMIPANQTYVKDSAEAAKAVDSPDTVGKVFAAEIVRRMGEVTDEEGQPKDSTDLQQSLGSTMDWIRERFGDETAAAAAGMILQATTSGVTEETLGTGLLNTLKFIDRNFGIAAGDQAIAQFNNSINQTVNAFFDNGKDELFFAAETSGSAAKQDLNARFISQMTVADDTDVQESLDQLTDILDDLRGELDQIGQLNDLASQLEDEFNPVAPSPEAAMAAYQAEPGGDRPVLASLSI